MLLNVTLYVHSLSCFPPPPSTATVDHKQLLILGIPEVSHLGLKRTERCAICCPSLESKMKYTCTKQPNLTVASSGQPIPRKGKSHVQGLWVPFWVKTDIPDIQSNAFNVSAVLCCACIAKRNIQMYKNCCIQLCTKLEALGHVVRKRPFILSRSVYCKSSYSLPDTDNIVLSQGRSSNSGLALENKITCNYKYIQKNLTIISVLVLL